MEITRNENWEKMGIGKKETVKIGHQENICGKWKLEKL